ncbi:MAG: epoxide hydrolase [Burkholderiales bacterium]|nr:epoxide hydrolase [Anaerolineae bacterium]
MTSNDSQIKPFTINIPQSALDDLQARLKLTRYPNELAGVGWDYGVTVDYVKKLVDYWQNGYDWRKLEAKLNQYPQFTTMIDGQNIHFFHVRSPEPNALPLILTHGWPGSFMEYIGVIDRLTNPRAHGGDPADAFHVVIPSLPGFGFSGPTTESGWNRYRTAKAWAELMRRLGYERYGAAGNDVGSNVSPEVGRLDGDHVVGVHVTQVFSFPSGDPAEFEKLSQDDYAALQHLQWFNDTMMGFNQLQSTKPQNVAFAIMDSPAGLLAWSGQLFGEDVDADFTLNNVMIYWVTGTAASAARSYYEDSHVDHSEYVKGPTTIPLAVAIFAGDFISIRPFAERDHKNIVQWNRYDTGGHYGSHSAPDLFTNDVRMFYRSLR